MAGIIGYYLNSFDKLEAWPQARWIYTEVVAGVSIILGFLWLIPCSFGFFSWPCMLHNLPMSMDSLLMRPI